MSQPVQLSLAAADGLWTLSEDGRAGHRFSHLEQATHEAVRRARELEETGQPARVTVAVADGREVVIDHDPEVTQEQERAAPDTPLEQ